MLIQRTHPTILAKVKSHAHIIGNDHADKLAKIGNTLPHQQPLHPYEKAHSTPYFFHMDEWSSMEQIPDKGLIRHLKPYLFKYDKEHYLKLIAQNFPYINKWTTDINIDNKTSNYF